MKPSNLLLFGMAISLAACTKSTLKDEPVVTSNLSETAAARVKPGTGTDLLFTQTNLFPEGVVYDKFNNRFYVSSTTVGDIGIVDRNGNYMPFITDPVLTSTTGLEIDEARKQLFVSNATDGSVGIYDINTGQRTAFVDLKPLLPGAPVFINDIALDPQGNAYVTNSRTPVIYKISTDGVASIFYYDPAFATSGFGFNGIEYGNQGGGFLLVAYSAANQVVKFPVVAPSSYSVVSLDATLAGPDGLLLSKNGKDLVVVNNAGGGNGKVIRFASKDQWRTGTALTTFETGPVFPTTATTDGKAVYVLYAYLNWRTVGQSDYTIKAVPGIDKFQ